jgi:hypothetical protein
MRNLRRPAGAVANEPACGRGTGADGHEALLDAAEIYDRRPRARHTHVGQEGRDDCAACLALVAFRSAIRETLAAKRDG